MFISMYDLGNLQETGDIGGAQNIERDQYPTKYPAHPHDSWYDALYLQGTADEISTSDDFVDLVAGLAVTRVGIGQHDGEPAVVLHFGPARMHVRPDTRIEWVRSFEKANERGDDGLKLMMSFEDSWRSGLGRPKVSTIKIDYAYEGETLEEALAELSSRFGVSTSVVDPNGPGGGWPVVAVSGLTSKVEEFLRSDDPYGYGCDDAEVRELLG